MKTSCLTHPANEPILLIRQWQVKIMDGDLVAAALLSFFEYRHSHRLESQAKARHANAVARQYGDERIKQEASLYQFHNEAALQCGIMGLAGKDGIRAGLKKLENYGFITVHRNPNQRYAFDRTKHFLFHPDKVQEWINDYERVNRSPNPSASSAKNRSRSPINRPPSPNSSGTISETTGEIASERGEESPPFAGAKEPDSLSAPEQGEDWDEDDGEIPTESPEDFPHAAKGTTDIPDASRPVLAADAAHGSEARPKVVLPDPHSSEFPKRGRHPDWCEGARCFDAANAQLMNQLWRVDLFTDNRTARKYYNARYNGRLTSRNVEMISRFWMEAPIDGDQAPRTLWNALDNDKLPVVLAACRRAVKNAINDIHTDGETDDGEMHTLQRISSARGLITAETDLVSFLDYYTDYVGPLLVGHAVEAQNHEAARDKYREQILDELCKWPSWLDRWTNHAKFPQILGYSIEEIREHQRRFADEKARCIAELQIYLR